MRISSREHHRKPLVSVTQNVTVGIRLALIRIINKYVKRLAPLEAEEW